LEELRDAVSSGDKSQIEDEIGDILFSLVNLSRFLGVNPEDSLRGTIAKFIRRFQYVESQMKKNGFPMKQENLSQMDKYWNDAKN